MLSTAPAFFGIGLQAGMVLAALPAFSAPIGVSEVPSFAASDSDTAAITPVASSDIPRTPACNRLFVIFMFIVILKTMFLEVHAEAQRHEVPIIDRGVLAIKEVGVGKVRGVGVLVLGIEPQADGLAPLFEVAAWAG